MIQIDSIHGRGTGTTMNRLLVICVFFISYLSFHRSRRVSVGADSWMLAHSVETEALVVSRPTPRSKNVRPKCLYALPFSVMYRQGRLTLIPMRTQVLLDCPQEATEMRRESIMVTDRKEETFSSSKAAKAYLKELEQAIGAPMRFG